MAVFFDWRIVLVLVAAALVRSTLLRTERQRHALMVVVGLGILAGLHPLFAGVVCAACWAIHALTSSDRTGPSAMKRMFVPSLTLCLAVLGVGKYGPAAMAALFDGDTGILGTLGPPLGLSYFAFRLLQYAFDCYRGVIRERSLLRLLAFVCFLPTFPAGPIETYTGFHEGALDRVTSNDVAYAIRRIVVGYVKKTLIGDLLLMAMIAPYSERVFMPDGIGLELMTAPRSAVFVTLAFVRAYVDLSAYSDIAIGFSRLLGHRVIENFAYPFWSRNLAEFWRSWHISLSMWCRNNVYFPVFGATRKAWLGLYASMLAMGLWHYVNWNWFAWAIFHGSGLIVVSKFAQWTRKKKSLKKRMKGRLGTAACCAFTFAYVALGYSFVATPDIGAAFHVFTRALAAPLDLVVRLLG